ncbi:MAG: MraY family glycosyltransferase [bacterium]
MNITALQPYFNLIPAVGGVFLVSLLLTPLVGYFAEKFNFLDLPASQRDRSDPSLAQRIHTHAKPRLGALAALIPFMFIFLTQVSINKQLFGILLGLSILIIGGIIDDKYELSSKRQFLIQFLSAILVVIFGTSIQAIHFAGINFNFQLFSHLFTIGQFSYNFIFPADLITIIWIVSIINSVNWVCGIDALGELLTVVAAITMTMLCIKSGNLAFAILPATLAAGILGYIPYNFPPSKIIGGTAGHTSYGYLLAVFSMLSGAKITTAIIILLIPLIDMIWVILYRMNKHKDIKFLKRPFVSGKVHLHHRLMSMGLNQKQVLFIETSGMAIVSVIAIYFGGFSDELIFLSILCALIISGFTIINLRNRQVKKHLAVVDLEQKNPQEPEPPTGDDDETPEERFAY